MIQFSFYVQGNVETLRDHFISFKGKMTAVAPRPPSGTVAGSAKKLHDIAQAFRGLLDEKELYSKLPLQEWVMPQFSTTRNDDRDMACIMMMGITNKSVDYNVSLTQVSAVNCGFPVSCHVCDVFRKFVDVLPYKLVAIANRLYHSGQSVTLDGTAADWQQIHDRMEHVEQYGDKPKVWSKLLRAVMKRFVASFATPDDQDIKQFWLNACHSAGQNGGCVGLDFLSGWITAFCFWSEDGRPLDSIHYPPNDRIRQGMIDNSGESTAAGLAAADFKPLELDGVQFHLVYPNGAGALEGRPSVPKSVLTIPVPFKDKRSTEDYHKRMLYKTTVVAGLVGMTLKEENGQHYYQPRSGWWVLQDSVEEMQDDSPITSGASTMSGAIYLCVNSHLKRFPGPVESKERIGDWLEHQAEDTLEDPFEGPVERPVDAMVMESTENADEDMVAPSIDTSDSNWSGASNEAQDGDS